METLFKIIGGIIFMFGFIILAFILLLGAINKKERISQYIMLTIGVILLIAQQGCCLALNNFNKGFGGGSDEMWITYLSQGLSIVFILVAGKLIFFNRS